MRSEITFTAEIKPAHLRLHARTRQQEMNRNLKYEAAEEEIILNFVQGMDIKIRSCYGFFKFQKNNSTVIHGNFFL